MKNIKEIDIIILSCAHTSALKSMTNNCIESLMNSEDAKNIKFNVMVIESNVDLLPYQYPCSRTFYTDKKFGYNRYMNIGIELTSSSLICLCNNDLIFHDLWATNMLKAFEQCNLSSGSPVCSIHHPKIHIELDSGIYFGYGVRHEISGWCIFLKREVLSFTGRLDENYEFWCSDNDYANTLFTLGLKHALVTSSVVDHLESRTLVSKTIDEQQQFIDKDLTYFKKKWNVRLGYEGWEIL